MKKFASLLQKKNYKQNKYEKVGYGILNSVHIVSLFVLIVAEGVHWVSSDRMLNCTVFYNAKML